MKSNIRNIVESDYEMLVEWWKDWGWDPVSKDMLPDNGTGGIIVEQDNKPIIAGFIYWSNSNVIWFDWIISDKKASRIKRAKSLIIMIDAVEEMARAKGKKYIITVSDNESFISTLSKKKWHVDKDPLKKIIKTI